ncbi:MAG TPA: hypothetical protein VGX25_11110 [Actinophytocola sp.]|uniref:hypothetical protein n=1 Tax=Actinophytocola sp. TaxID=1872138 RepID=UPI002DDC9904|nr:hypothetical protein [Actinophytocola sp.]HEV2779935.1 hypothetical protein [Actinophytocola sp.]
MERLTTGRRHIRAGSVHVTELIRKQLPPFELPSPRQGEAGQPAASGALESLLDQAEETAGSHRRPPSRGAQLAKIAGLGVASFALCASIAVASMINHQRAGMPTEAGPRPAGDISGEQALLPDLLNRVVPQTGITGMPELPGAQTNATGMIENTGPPAPATPPASPPSPGAVPPDAELSKKDVVARFYELVSTAPDRAFGLLDSTLLGTDLGEFVRAWTNVSEIQLLDVRERGDDVLAVVRLRLPDGGYLRVQQLLDVANTIPRRITGAEILSAQRN